MTFQEEVRRVASMVDSYLEEEVDGAPRDLYDASSHLIRAGGKRLRPFILVEFHALYSPDEAAVLPAAAAVELIHNFTLIHDDIMDRDEIRHGVPTVHRKYGEALAILAGDVLFAKVFSLLTRTPALSPPSRTVEAVKIVAESLVTLCEGQALDMNAPKIEQMSEEGYYSTIEKKTSALFEASASIGCIAGGGSPEDVGRAASYARHLGLAFQLVDDVLGVVGDPGVTGKPVGGDLREGKRTMPIMLAVREAAPSDREKILSVWGKGNAEQGALAGSVEIIRSMGIDQKVRSLARGNVERALEALGPLPDAEAKRYLVQLAHFVMDRRM